MTIAFFGYSIVWTPPYSPKFQPIELVWGAAKQRAAGMYHPGRDLKTTRLHLRMGFYGGEDGQGKTWDVVNVAGCWRTAKEHINAWITKDCGHVADGLSGSIDDPKGAEAWTQTSPTFLDITDVDVNEDPRPVDVVGAVEVDRGGGPRQRPRVRQRRGRRARGRLGGRRWGLRG